MTQTVNIFIYCEILVLFTQDQWSRVHRVIWMAKRTPAFLLFKVPYNTKQLPNSWLYITLHFTILIHRSYLRNTREPLCPLVHACPELPFQITSFLLTNQNPFLNLASTSNLMQLNKHNSHPAFRDKTPRSPSLWWWMSRNQPSFCECKIAKPQRWGLNP